MTRIGITEPRSIFRVTFETITEDSAVNGDADQRGWLNSWGAPVDEPEASEWDFRELIDRFSGCAETTGDGSPLPRWITAAELRQMCDQAWEQGWHWDGWTCDVWNPGAPGSPCSPRRDGGGVARCGTRLVAELRAWHGEQRGKVSMQAWASPLACPIR